LINTWSSIGCNFIFAYLNKIKYHLIYLGAIFLFNYFINARDFLKKNFIENKITFVRLIRKERGIFIKYVYTIYKKC